ncbi:MAG TPA: polyprenol monophosphomannose synthase [Thermoleophilaceae bacterium]|nr:polyprenol monophosphomannose synthase [Thermoleophilaceae bacterium]
MLAVWLILPTYNEAQNLEPLVRAVLPALEESDAEPHVLIVDDSSPDGTGELADGLAAELGPVEVLHRPRKQGLGRAYLAGFGVALERGADLVLEMDSDFSHDPVDLPRLISAAGAADLVLGSRYVPGGGITDWGAIRRLLSRGGSAYARWLLGVPVRDLTGGFKCFRREVLEGITLDDVHADGYGFQIELTYRAILAGFTVTEVPIVFRERRVGRSKMTARIALEAVWKVPALRLRLRGPPLPPPAREGAREAPTQSRRRQ